MLMLVDKGIPLELDHLSSCRINYVGESRDSSIPHTLSDCDASPLLLILPAEFLHCCDVSEAARDNLVLLVNAAIRMVSS